jgi:CHAD domain-containing protein
MTFDQPEEPQAPSTPELLHPGNGRPAAPVVDLMSILVLALRERWRKYRRQLRRLDELTPSAVHELRIALRRLSATVNLVAIVLPTAQLKKLQRQLRRRRRMLNRLRDIQVLHPLVQTRAFDNPMLQPLCDDLVLAERRLLARTGRQISELGMRRLRRRIRTLRRQLERDLAQPAAQARTLKQAKRSIATGLSLVLSRFREARSDPRALHGVRVSLKRLRYTVEVLRPLLDNVDDAYMKQLQAAQLALGEIQDLLVLRRWLTDQAEHALASGRSSRTRASAIRKAARETSLELRERVAALRARPDLIKSLDVLRAGRPSIALTDGQESAPDMGVPPPVASVDPIAQRPEAESQP